MIAASSQDGSFRLWDVSLDWKPKLMLDRFRSSVTCADFWPLDITRLVTCTDDGTSVWNDLMRPLHDWIPVLEQKHVGNSTLRRSDLINWKLTDAYNVLNFTDDTKTDGAA
jgi:WD40 repeat protein